jgi:uncharacterized iron-regulated membrane protein
LATIIGLSGSAIVFRDSLNRELSPELYPRIETKKPLDFDSMLATVRDRFPSRTVLAAGPTKDGVWIFQMRGELRPEYRTFVFVDPNTNRVLGTQEEDEGIINFLVMLHIELLSGDNGILVEGFAGVLLFVLSGIGIVLWWPGRTRWRGALKIRLHARWSRLNWDLHTAGGLFASILLLLLSFTGAYYCLPIIGSGVSLLTGGHKNDMNVLFQPSLSTSSHGFPDTKIQPLIERASDSVPGLPGSPYKLVVVELPVRPESPISIQLDNGMFERIGTLIIADFDRRDGHLLRELNLSNAPLGVRLMLLFRPLHFGTWGGTGTRILWGLVGVMPGVLSITGFLMWWRRVLRKRWSGV